MSRNARGAGLLLALAALLPGAVARAADTPAAATAPTVEDRLRDLESSNRALTEKLRTLQEQLQPPPPTPPPPVAAEAPADSGEPFAWGDFTWMNGTSRQTARVFDTKYFTPQLDIDSNYTYSFNHPIDNTLVGSTAHGAPQRARPSPSSASAATCTSATCAGASSCSTARAPSRCRATTSPSIAASSTC